ncbi:MAG: PRC-barrel domain-containing protein, partial [Mycobacteriales bacterium]
MTFPAENLRDWRNHDVVDVKGSKIGKLESLYFDTASEEAVFAAVEVGMIGRRRLTFVPLRGAVVSPSYVKVTVGRHEAKKAPSIDSDGELTADMEPEVFA